MTDEQVANAIWHPDAKLTKHAKLLGLAILRFRVEGVNDPGDVLLAERCGISERAVYRAKAELADPSKWGARMVKDPQYINSTARLPDVLEFTPTRPTDSKATSDLTASEAVRVKNAVVPDLPHGHLLPERRLIIKGRANGVAPIEAKRKNGEALEGLTEKEESGAASLTAVEDHHRALAAEYGVQAEVDVEEILRKFDKHHDAAGTMFRDAAHRSSQFYGYLKNSCEWAAERSQKKAAKPKPVRASRKKQGVPSAAHTSCEIDPVLWPDVLAAVPDLDANLQHFNLEVIVKRDMHEVPAVTLAVARALGIADEVSTGDGFRFDAGHEQAVRDYIEKHEQQAA